MQAMCVCVYLMFVVNVFGSPSRFVLCGGFFFSLFLSMRNNTLITNYHTSLSINFLKHLWLFGVHSPQPTSKQVGKRQSKQQHPYS